MSSQASKCPKCEKQVYPMDRVRAMEKDWHKACLKCTECQCRLDIRMLNSHGGKPYYKIHVPKERTSSTKVTSNSVTCSVCRTLCSAKQTIFYQSQPYCRTHAPVQESSFDGRQEITCRYCHAQELSGSGHLERCPERPVPCPHCQALQPLSQQELHVAVCRPPYTCWPFGTCPTETTVACPYCSTVFQRYGDLSDHVGHCWSRPRAPRSADVQQGTTKCPSNEVTSTLTTNDALVSQLREEAATRFRLEAEENDARVLHTRVVATFSLAGKSLWQPVSPITLEDLAALVQPPAFDSPAVVISTDQLSYAWCLCADGNELYVGDYNHGCLAVYRDDGVLQRRVGEELRPAGAAVAGERVFVTDDANHVSVYPRAGGPAVRRFGVRQPMGIGVCSGRVYVVDNSPPCVTAFAEDDGAFIANGASNGELGNPFGLAIADDKIFVASRNCVCELHRDSLRLERRIGAGHLKDARGVAVMDGLLFVSDYVRRSITAFDIATGNVAASVGGFDGTPYGVAVGQNGALFVTAKNFVHTTGAIEWRLYVTRLL